MYGFIFLNNDVSFDSELLSDSRSIKSNCVCYYKMLPRFENDRLMFRRNDVFFLLDGVILNKREIMERYKTSSWENTFYEMVQSDEEAFPNQLRGSFCGIIYDEKKKQIRAYTDFFGEKTIFYYFDKDTCVVTSHMRLMDEALQKLGYKIEPDLQGCHEMLVTGSCLHGNTVIKGVHRLIGGKMVYYADGNATETRYHMFHNIPEHELSLDECIEKTDALFRKAVDQIYAKNEEYGYDLEADLSGGLDSRLVTWVAHDLGYKDVLNVCWCMKGKIDHTTSRAIAKELGNRYYFYPINNGDFLMDVDEVVKITGGGVNYFIGTGANRTLNQLNLSNVGMEITGLMGELHNAYWIEADKHTPAKYITNRDYTNTVKLDYPASYCDEYDNYEQMNLYEFSALLYLSSCLVRQNRVEVVSPYMDKDFLEFAYRIPLKWRKDHYFTMAWMCKKYPRAAKFVWQLEMKPVEKVFYKKVYIPQVIWMYEKRLKKLYNKFCTALKINSKMSYKNDMNPVDMWFSTNPKIRDFFRNYYLETRYLVKDKKMYEEMKSMMKTNRGYEQLAVINLLAIYKLYFNKIDK